ncbi:MAG: hypothetical protein NZ518_01595 [Dehalococcoidia bacterium]|nr:hypothetical protein [Dehalococcoidia bacterium]
MSTVQPLGAVAVPTGIPPIIVATIGPSIPLTVGVSRIVTALPVVTTPTFVDFEIGPDQYFILTVRLASSLRRYTNAPLVTGTISMNGWTVELRNSIVSGRRAWLFVFIPSECGAVLDWSYRSEPWALYVRGIQRCPS